MPKIGVISDTHGFLDEQIPKLFAGVEHILHAGDLGARSILLQLEDIAPVTAVLGNVDEPVGLRLTEVVELAGQKFLLHHIVNPRRLGDDLQGRLARVRPRAVIFGHSHLQFCETIDGVLFFNPGYAGRPRFNQPRSVAILDCAGGDIRPQYFPLDGHIEVEGTAV
jgi:putative phosphoesterase